MDDQAEVEKKPAKVDSIAKQTQAKKKTQAKKQAVDQSKTVQQGKNLIVNNGYIPQVLFIEPGINQGEYVCDDQMRVTKKEVWV